MTADRRMMKAVVSPNFDAVVGLVPESLDNGMVYRMGGREYIKCGTGGIGGEFVAILKEFSDKDAYPFPVQRTGFDIKPVK
ncbi:MAG: hypothetical protein FJY76_01285 [Candidatus Aenigmarchaeota archaeon]|nr:hypothetical protein [Candidatus Aenigmarchaeota archaeon]